MLVIIHAVVTGSRTFI